MQSRRQDGTVATIISRKYNAFEIAEWLKRLGNRVQISGMPPRNTELLLLLLLRLLRDIEKGEIVSLPSIIEARNMVQTTNGMIFDLAADLVWGIGARKMKYSI